MRETPPAVGAASRRTTRKIILVAPSFRFLGGLAVQADTLLRAWRHDPDVTASLIPFDPLPPPRWHFLMTVKYVRTVVTQLLYIPLLMRQLARADVVHVLSAAHSSFLLAAVPAIVVARLLGKPVVLNYHSGEAASHLRRSRLARAVMARVDAIVVQSSYLQRIFSTFGLDTAVVPNVVDFDRFRFKRRRQFAPRLLCTRNFERRYNVACTIRAFRIVKDRYPGATLTLAGFGREETALRALVRSLKLEGVFFAGRVPVEEMPRYYDAADLFVQTPDVDNMPLSILQAFAAGVPVVSTDAGGVPTILQHERDGLLAPKGDHEAVAAHIVRLLEDQALAAQISEAAFASCRRYAWNAIRRQWLDVYDSVFAPIPPSAPARQRVVVFTTAFEPGGTERQMSELIRRLDRRRFEVHVACFHRRGAWLPPVEQAAASVRAFPIRRFAAVATAFQLLAFVRWCRALRPSALHCTGLYANVFGMAGGFLAGVPLRIASRREINPGRSAGLLIAQRAAYALAHVVVANCNAAAEQLRREGVDDRRIVVIRNGIDAVNREVRGTRAAADHVIVVANLRPEKGHDTLLQAIPALVRRRPALRFTFVGDGPLRRQLTQRCNRLGIADHVSFLGHREDVASLLAASDLFVLPSRSEATPNAIIEAMAAGLPVVACAVGGVCELVKPGRTGLLVPPDQPRALAAAIEALLARPREAHELGRRGRYLIRADYRFDVMVAAYQALYSNRPAEMPASSRRAA